MAGRASGKAIGALLLAATVPLYFFRPASCGMALSRIAPTDTGTYVKFDYHGWGVLTGWATALVFAAPLLFVAARIFLRSPVRPGLFGVAGDRRTTLASIAIAAAIGAPSIVQIEYLDALSPALVAPVIVSALLWLGIVEVARTMAVRSGTDRATAYVAIGLAVILTLPKILLFSSTATAPA